MQVVPTNVAEWVSFLPSASACLSLRCSVPPLKKKVVQVVTVISSVINLLKDKSMFSLYVSHLIFISVLTLLML